MSSRIFHTFSYIRLSIYNFILGSLIYLELSVVPGDEYVPIVFFYVQTSVLTSTKFWQYYFLCVFLASLQNKKKVQVFIFVWIYVWVFNLINVSVFISTPHWFYYYSSLVPVELGSGASRTFIVQIVLVMLVCCCFVCLLGVCVYINLRFVISWSVKKCFEISMGVALILHIVLCRMDTFTMLILLKHEHGRSFYPLRSSISSSDPWVYNHTSLSFVWLELSPRYFLLFEAIVFL